ncbi:hypothetical protein LEP1GSC047_2089 [Leptospira inadai serovar Lyme str. 10]|uniref:Thioesterase domain-containing protein n=2 Tax=Leptospira inadai serovar Lyme TaxID=293084 RepID=V6I069_9LEPT|nr:hotdog fold thioesterase [Leptospira inadai]EQA38659.1 hypothetical protein LEP1GSC047_2089 [Leptospira inadai serovar Lyme str. 10]PNV71519.1 thioesterase [Leptospira inadai serovar Lyme]
MVDWEKHFRSLEQMYSQAPINRFFQPRISVSKGFAELTIEIRDDFHHAAGAAHGAVYFKAVDDAAFFAANSLEPDYFVLTSSITLFFLRPIRSGTMIAKGKVVQNSQNLIVAESNLFDTRGKEIGRGIGSFAKSKIRLTPEIGYFAPTDEQK